MNATHIRVRDKCLPFIVRRHLLIGLSNQTRSDVASPKCLLSTRMTAPVSVPVALKQSQISKSRLLKRILGRSFKWQPVPAKR